MEPLKTCFRPQKMQNLRLNGRSICSGTRPDSGSKLKSYVSQQLTFMFEIKNNSKQNEKKHFEQ